MTVTDLGQDHRHLSNDERFFSREHHICVDTRPSLKAESITELMCCKEWIRAGFLSRID